MNGSGIKAFVAILAFSKRSVHSDSSLKSIKCGSCWTVKVKQGGPPMK